MGVKLPPCLRKSLQSQKKSTMSFKLLWVGLSLKNILKSHISITHCVKKTVKKIKKKM